MTFLEQRINREVLPFLKGYRKFWKFSFTRDIELDDEAKVANTNSIKASTFLQYYQSGFPIEASMELAGLDKNQYKFDIGMLEAEIMQNQMMMLGQQPGEQGGGEDVGGMENMEQGRYGAASEMYLGNERGSSEGTDRPENTPRDPSIDEEQYKKADIYDEMKRERLKKKANKKYEEREHKDTSREAAYFHEGQYEKAKGTTMAGTRIDPLNSPMVYQEDWKKEHVYKGREPSERDIAAESNRQAGKKLQEENDASTKNTVDTIKTVAQLAPLVLAKKKKSEKNTVEKSITINPALVGAGIAALGVRAAWGHAKKKQKEREDTADKEEKEYQSNYEKEKVEDEKNRREAQWKKPSTTNTNTKPTQAKVHTQTTIYGKQRATPGTKVWKSLTVDKPDEREDMNYNPYWLAEGIRIEMEHTNDPEVAKEIAKDHLDEFMDYYASLRKMENALRSGNRPFTKCEMYKAGDMVKAKVYITHPSEAPKGRAVRRGNKGGYYYITNQRERGGAAATQSGEHAQKKKSGGHKGWQAGGGEAPSEGMPQEAPVAPDIEGAEMQVKISGNGVGIVVGIISGRLVASKLNTPQTAQFVKIVEKKTGERANPEDIIEIMVMTAEEMGLEVT
jgi:hypothetical protein